MSFVCKERRWTRRGCVIRFHGNGNGVVGTAEQRDERQSEGVATGRKDRDREREGGRERKRENGEREKGCEDTSC